MRDLSKLINSLRLDRKKSAWSNSQTLAMSLEKLKGEIDESIEALESGDRTDLKMELGDALWSLIFALIVAEEEQEIGIGEITAAALAKLRARKPWLSEGCPKLTIQEEEVLWTKAKLQEKLHSG